MSTTTPTAESLDSGATRWWVLLLVGVSFSLVPAILWPSVAHVVTPVRSA